MRSPSQLISILRSRPVIGFAIGAVAVAGYVGAVGFTGIPAVERAADCPSGNNGSAACSTVNGLQLSVPQGAQACPGSGVGASCPAPSGPASIAPGVASTPDGAAPCAWTGGAAFSSPAACGESAAPGSAARVNLVADTKVAQIGQKVTLMATAASSVTSTNKAIEIFDMTARIVVGACMQGSQCTVAYAAGPSAHDFAAFVTDPVKTPPSGGSVSTSPRISVNWVGATLTSQTPVVGPGKPITLTAAAWLAPQPAGYLVQVFDADNGQRLTYCGRGTSCSVSLTSPTAASRSIIAIVAKPSPTLPANYALAQSDRLEVTWLGASISASSIYQIGGSVNLSAATNADLTNTPWSLGIVDEQGHLVGQPCKSGNTCAAQVAFPDGPTPRFRAVVGQVPPQSPAQTKIGKLLQPATGPTALVDIQAQSDLAQPVHLLWGVDSCKSFTGDPSAATGLYPAISGVLGAPQFWGRYLTNTVCPGLSATEVAAAHSKHLGILPIYNDYNCSNVAGYATGQQYAAAAAWAAKSLGIPPYHAIAIDIEPPGAACPGAANVDTGFIQGWFDGIMGAHYMPVYYGDATAGSAFATQWCYAVNALPYIGQKSYLWSFQPSLYGGYMRSNAPGFAPNLTGCVGYVHAWQYQIGGDSSTPDVDGDEATSELPLWYP